MFYRQKHRKHAPTAGRYSGGRLDDRSFNAALRPFGQILKRARQDQTRDTAAENA